MRLRSRPPMDPGSPRRSAGCLDEQYARSQLRYARSQLRYARVHLDALRTPTWASRWKMPTAVRSTVSMSPRGTCSPCDSSSTKAQRSNLCNSPGTHKASARTSVRSGSDARADLGPRVLRQRRAHRSSSLGSSLSHRINAVPRGCSSGRAPTSATIGVRLRGAVERAPKSGTRCRRHHLNWPPTGGPESARIGLCWGQTPSAPSVRVAFRGSLPD